MLSQSSCISCCFVFPPIGIRKLHFVCLCVCVCVCVRCPMQICGCLITSSFLMPNKEQAMAHDRLMNDEPPTIGGVPHAKQYEVPLEQQSTGKSNDQQRPNLTEVCHRVVRSCMCDRC